jgi:CHAD domain-containing protein
VLTEAVEAAAAAERARLRETLKGSRVNGFLLDLAAFIETRGWVRPDDAAQAEALAAPVGGQARASLAECWQRVAKRAKGIAGLTVAQRHELRKRLKRLRYTVEFLAPLYEKERSAPFLKRLKTLQDVFGELNDRALAEAVLTGPEAPAAGDPAAQRATGRILGAHEQAAKHAWDSAKADWAALKAEGRFWE